ncbi:MAG: hypothetical protein E7031_02435 [Akkermansiaceae bacterium]|nr:hypothetical protein [Akkermansiaceae bacterium]
MTYTLTTIQTLALTVAFICLTALPATIIALHFPRLRKGAGQVLILCKERVKLSAASLLPKSTSMEVCTFSTAPNA